MAIKIKNKANCTGCGACEQVCAIGAISLKEDREGFWYPTVDKTKCTDCGACERACSVLHPNTSHTPIAMYVAKSRRESIREVSSSGGIFSLLALEIIAQGGVVFGAKFNECWEVVHDYTQTEEGLAAFRGSKYVQSRIGDNFTKAKEFLEGGRKVLFSGTPCQIAGLKRFLGREWSNLLTVDLICHGVPSPAVWERYKWELLSREDIPFGSRSSRYFKDIKFRSKKNGWRNFSSSYIISERNSTQEYTISDFYYREPYMWAFVENLYLRPSCHLCPAKPMRSGSDITLGDFWGVDNFLPEFNDDKGASFVVINSAEGDAIYQELGVESIEPSGDVCCYSRYNKNLYQSSIPHPKRSVFFRRLNRRGVRVTSLINRLVRPLGYLSLWTKIVWNSKRVIMQVKGCVFKP